MQLAVKHNQTVSLCLISLFSVVCVEKQEPTAIFQWMVYIVQGQKIWKIKYRQNKILLWGVLKLSDIVSQLLFHEQLQTYNINNQLDAKITVY